MSERPDPTPEQMKALTEDIPKMLAEETHDPWTGEPKSAAHTELRKQLAEGRVLWPDQARRLLDENERLRDALVALLAAVEDDGLDAAWGDEKFKTIVAAREAVRLAS